MFDKWQTAVLSCSQRGASRQVFDGENQETDLNPSWDRSQLAAYADRLLACAQKFVSPGHGRITLPGAEGGYGHDIDGLEGFARTFLAAGFRLKGENGADPTGLAEFYARGIAAGTDQSQPDRWIRPSEHGQPKVEAASIALILDMTRPWIWDQLDDVVQQRTVDYLAEVVGDHTYPKNNWCWFRLVVETFLKSVGGPYSVEDMEADLALHDSFVREGGWLSDGPGRDFDHYAGWALHLYPTLWARMQGADELAKPRKARDRELLDRFLMDAVHLVGGTGGPLMQGRSLTYRFAAAAPFWVGAIAEVPSTPLAQLRRAATSVIGHFDERGAPDADGLLSIGWFHPWRQIAQSYSGPSSPYWATKGLLGLALPASHPVWSAPDVVLPIERDGGFLTTFDAPGWIVSGTSDDGVVRVINHGTDHASLGDDVGDSPLYARLGYSTSTSPLLFDAAWRQPLEGSIAFVDVEGRGTHRAGFTPLGVTVDADAQVAVGGSRAHAHWIDMPDVQVLHGAGFTGEVQPAGTITMVSIVRKQWEVRLARVEDCETGLDQSQLKLRFTGWPTVDGDDMTSSLIPVAGDGFPGSMRYDDASPLGPSARVPHLDFPVAIGHWVGALVTLTGAPSDDVVSVSLDGNTVRVTWPDATTTSSNLPT